MLPQSLPDKTLDPKEISAASYHDDTLRMAMPRFAAASAKNEAPCVLESRLERDGEYRWNPKTTTESQSGKLADWIQLDPWKSERGAILAQHKSLIRLTQIGAAASWLIAAACVVLGAQGGLWLQTWAVSPGSEPVAGWATGLMAFICGGIGGAVAYSAAQAMWKVAIDRVFLRAIYLGTAPIKTFRCPQPPLPESVKALIEREQKNFKDVHILWDAADSWELGTMERGCKTKEIIVVGETTTKKFQVLSTPTPVKKAAGTGKRKATE